jgi:glycine/D-amino acid oxidase-like deaminating enzyme
MNSYDVLVVGAGIFGVTAALSLNERGYKTAVIDPGPIPHPLAASTDISKVIRMEYGHDADYMEMVEDALPLWEQWNQTLGETIFHKTGVTMLTRQPMAPGGYEYESYHLLQKRGHHPERLTSDDIARRFPAWKGGAFVDGYYHPQGGFAESGRLVELLIEQAREAGVAFHIGEAVTELLGDSPDSPVTGVRTHSGTEYHASQTLIAAGSWTPLLLPELQPVMKASGHPVFHLKPNDPSLFTPPYFTVFTADIANSGWYGFPLHPKKGVVKIANHGVGEILDPARDERVVTDADIRRLRNFLGDTFPALKEASIVYTRRCLYCDTLDEHLWIDRHPGRQGLVVAAGGSGHGFKFAPILGAIIADAVEGKANKWLPKFAWRSFEEDTQGEEAARFHG